MPPAMVKKWAKEKGMSTKEAERRWAKAKLLASKQGRNPEITGVNKDWEYVVGIYRTMMKKKPKTESLIHKSLIETMIDQVLNGKSPSQLIHSFFASSSSDSTPIRESDNTINVGDSYVQNKNLRTFFDGEGKLRFCTTENVLIRPNSDPRLLELVAYADCLSVDNPLFDVFESYEGSLEDLYDQVTSAYSLVTQTGA